MTNSERFQGLPAPAPYSSDAVIRELGDGLVLRRASPADAEALGAFYAVGLADPPGYAPDTFTAVWTRELLGGEHPGHRARDFAVVEDTKRSRFASATGLLSHRLRFGGSGGAGGVEFDAGQPELVATHPDYRNRGLVRALFDVVHRWSAERGHLLQLIDGIPWFYRQFGYEFALDRLVGCTVARTELGATEPPPEIQVRPATSGDAALLARLYDLRGERDLLFCERGADAWRYELARDPLSYARRDFRIIERKGHAVAAFGFLPFLLAGTLMVMLAETEDEVAWSDSAPAILYGLERAGHELEMSGPRVGAQGFERLGVLLATRHPIYAFLSAEPQIRRKPGVYYVRVPDPVAFLARVSPALEHRLAVSDLAGHTGTLDLNLYRSGVRLRFERGELVRVSSWEPSTDASGHAAFPDLSFLQLLFGFRSADELDWIFPDCVLSGPDVRALLVALFPKQSSDLWLTW